MREPDPAPDDEQDERAPTVQTPADPEEAVEPAVEGPETDVDIRQAEDEDTREATVFVVRPGTQGLKELAKMVYEDETLWPKIWLANQDLIEDPEDLDSGQRLVIPPKAPLTSVEKAAAAGYEATRTTPTDPAQVVHTVTPRDVSLTNLARRYYNDGLLWPKIWAANRGVLPNPDDIERGMQLVIPPKAPLTAEEQRLLDAYLSGELDAADPDTPNQEREDPERDQPAPEQKEPEPAEPARDEQNAETDQAPAEDQQPSPTAADDVIHTVVRGDVSVMGLARTYYGDGFLWPKIWVANRDQLPTPEAMELGMQLKIPPKAPLTDDERRALDAYNNRR